jgi:hypothetical protein
MNAASTTELTINGRTYGFNLRASVDCGGIESYSAYLILRGAPYRFQVLVSASGLSAIPAYDASKRELGEVPRRYHWDVQEDLTNELLQQILYN